jgi:hypothetical protein
MSGGWAAPAVKKPAAKTQTMQVLMTSAACRQGTKHRWVQHEPTPCGQLVPLRCCQIIHLKSGTAAEWHLLQMDVRNSLRRWQCCNTGTLCAGRTHQSRLSHKCAAPTHPQGCCGLDAEVIERIMAHSKAGLLQPSRLDLQPSRTQARQWSSQADH